MISSQLRRDTIHTLAGNHDLEDLTDSAAKTLCSIATYRPEYLSEIIPMLGPAWNNHDSLHGSRWHIIVVVLSRLRGTFGLSYRSKT
jgi:hypothetical protein